MTALLDSLRPSAEPRRPGPGPERQRAGRTAAVWLGAAAVAAAVLVAAGSLSGVFEGWRWLEHSTVTVAAVAASAASLRVFRAASPWPTLAALLGLALALTLQFFSDTALLGFIPNASTVERVLEMFPAANEAVLTQSPPVLAEEPLVFLTCLSVGLVAVAVDLVAFGLRFPAFSAVPLAVILGASSLIKPDGAGMAHVAATCVGYLAILGAARLIDAAQAPRAALRSGLGRQAALIAGMSVAAMLVVPLALPGFTTGLLPEGRRLYLWGQPSGINPVLNLGNNLRSPLGLTSVRYFTDSEEPLYLRTAVIGDLDAERWSPSDDEVDRQPVTGDLDGEPFGSIVSATVDVNTRISTGNYQSPWLPLPTGARSVSGLEGEWGWYPETATVLGGSGSSSTDQDFRVSSSVPELTPELLVASDEAGSPPGPGLSGDTVPDVYSSVPGELPDIIRDTADAIVREADADTSYGVALALQNHLRGTDFTYSEDTPLEQGYDGNGLAVVEAFLEQKSGYCIHYASAMALMARSLDIPSRIVVGYAPGRTNGEVTQGPGGRELQGYSLSPRSAHAWPELYFTGIGWVQFEPTPGRGTTPDYAPDVGAGVPDATEDPLLPGTAAPTTNPASPEPAEETPGARGAGGPDGGGAGEALRTLGLALAALAALCVPHAVRRLVRARRLRAVRAMDHPAAGSVGWRDGTAAAWDELVALGLDYGLRMLPAETALDYERRLKHQVPDAAASLELLRGSYERARYSRAGAPEPADTGSSGAGSPAGGRSWAGSSESGGSGAGRALESALRGVELELSAVSSPAARLRARALPASLFAR
ncbi:MAG: DUF3488 and transglutaminase-like domain-containing protein [Arthrobacter sp.]|uniref:transglutaminase TgpA family protein n=1 Tax=Arthrobacter sp. TaxID=1667 RepID=UPI003476D320